MSDSLLLWLTSGWMSVWTFPAALVGISLWALGFYWGWGRQADRLIDLLATQMPVAVASALSIVPFIGGAIATEWLWEYWFNPSWAISCAVLTCMGSGILRLGQIDSDRYRARDTEEQDSDTQ